MRKLTLVLLGSAAMCLSACGYSKPQQSADAERAQQQEQQLEEAQKQVPAPVIRNWNELRMFTATMERRDQVDLPTWTYTKNLDGKYTFICESLGYGIPYNTRANNPVHYEYLTTRTGKVLSGSTGQASSSNCGGDNGYADGKGCIWGEHAIVPQAEPNGLFIPESAKGTWNTCRDPRTGKPDITYQEEDVAVFPFRLPDEMVEGFHPAPLPKADPRDVERLFGPGASTPPSAGTPAPVGTRR